MMMIVIVIVTTIMMIIHFTVCVEIFEKFKNKLKFFLLLHILYKYIFFMICFYLSRVYIIEKKKLKQYKFIKIYI